jgi:lysostaphin
MRRSVVSLLVTLACFSPTLAAEPELFLSSSTVQPGDTLRVELDNVPPTRKYSVLFGSKTYPCYAVGPNAQRVLIGIPLGTKPADVTLEVKPAEIDEKLPLLSSNVTIASRTYPTEKIRFTKQKTELMRAEKRESALIGRLKKKRTPEQWWEGAFVEPVQGPVIGLYGLHRIRNETIDAGYHKGVDLRAKEGTPIKAANAGVVEMALPLRAHGKTVLLNHGQGVMSIYLHMSSILVRPGQKVRKGQSIGRVGSTGLSTAPHLHWQVYVHGVPVDPQPWLTTEF